MTMIEVACPDCQRTKVIKAGKQPNGAQRYRCQNPTCQRTIFQLTYIAQGRLPETQRQIVEMALNGSGIRDTARVLRVSPVTVLRVLKKRAHLNSGQSSGVGHPDFARTRAYCWQGWRPPKSTKCGPLSVRKKLRAGCGMRWIIAPGRYWPTCLGDGKIKRFCELKALLVPFGITRFYTDGWGAYQRHLAPALHEVGKHHTQQLERKHLTLRTRIKRLVRKTICFSKSIADARSRHRSVHQPL